MKKRKCVLCKNSFSVKQNSDPKKFCSRSCSITYSNKNRIYSEETKKKISNSLINLKDNPSKYRVCKVAWTNCVICEKLFAAQPNGKSTKKTCSLECRSIAYSIGGRKSAAKQGLSSKEERKLFELCFTNFPNLNVTRNTPISNHWDADIVIHDHNVAILWNGAWHREKLFENHNVDIIKKRDKLKKEVLEHHGWNVLIFDDDKHSPESAFEVISRIIEV